MLWLKLLNVYNDDMQVQDVICLFEHVMLCLVSWLEASTELENLRPQ
jgi:hypothetical protein